MPPKERRDCGQKDLFCARLDQMARLLERHPMRIGRLQPKSRFRLARRPPAMPIFVSLNMGIPVWDRLNSSPMKIIMASCMAALTLCLAGVALADDLQTVGDPDSLGFSARRLERMTYWFESQSKKGDPSGFVVGIAKDGK